MRVKHKPWAKDHIKENTNIFLNEYFDNEKVMSNLFAKYQQIELEIGCGKGQFIIQKAEQNPHILYIAIEKQASVIVSAAKKLNEQKIENLKFLNIDVQKLLDKDLFKNKITTIYLNFSDPWPKKRHQKRRLTAPSFLNIYSELLITNGEIIQKTDNTKLFEYSVLSLANSVHFQLEELYLDLHNEDIVNIKTEYEEKFSKKGFLIKYLRAKKVN